MLATVKQRILGALAGATSHKPVDCDNLYALGSWEQIEAGLLELYRAREICCCKITRGGKERIVWWPVGTIVSAGYGKKLA